mgnify:CR=1 FL=1
MADAASDRDMANRYEQTAQAGDEDAQFYLGALYSAGVGRSRSDAEAFRWFSRAADQGHAHAMLIVAGLYASGRTGWYEHNLYPVRYNAAVDSVTRRVTGEGARAKGSVRVEGDAELGNRVVDNLAFTI